MRLIFLLFVSHLTCIQSHGYSYNVRKYLIYAINCNNKLLLYCKFLIVNTNLCYHLLFCFGRMWHLKCTNKKQWRIILEYFDLTWMTVKIGKIYFFQQIMHSKIFVCLFFSSVKPFQILLIFIFFCQCALLLNSFIMIYFKSFFLSV